MTFPFGVYSSYVTNESSILIAPLANKLTFFVRSIINYNKPLLREHTDLPEIGKQKVNQSK